MENITIGQVIGIIGSITVISSFFFGIYKFIKNIILDKIKINSRDISNLKREIVHLKNEVEDSKEERVILIKGQLACLKGLQELNCNGPVTKAIDDIEAYLMQKSHN